MDFLFTWLKEFERDSLFLDDESYYFDNKKNLLLIWRNHLRNSARYIREI